MVQPVQVSQEKQFSSPITAPKSLTSQGCRVRRAKAADTSQLLQFVKALADYEKLSHEMLATPMQLTLALFGPEPQAYALLAEVNGQAAGMAIYCYRFSSFRAGAHLFLDTIYVDPASRGYGVGKQLFRALARIAHDSLCTEIHWRVLDWNEPSIGFYQKLGAAPQSGWDYYALKGSALQSLAGHEITH